MISNTHTPTQDELAKLDPGLMHWYSSGAPGTRDVLIRLSGIPDAALSAKLASLGLAVWQAPVLTGTVTREQLEALIAMPEVVEIADGTIKNAYGG